MPEPPWSPCPSDTVFTFGQRLDGQTLDALEIVVRAIFAPTGAKAALLQDLNIQLEVLRALWRLVHDQRWTSAQQLVFGTGRIDEIGRMTGGWLRQLPSGKTT